MCVISDILVLTKTIFKPILRKPAEARFKILINSHILDEHELRVSGK